jgi:L-amino acid N-acyltransferase YncA
MIRGATVEDAGAICSIYNPYVTGTAVTFEEEAVTVDAMRGRIAEVSALFPWLVFEERGEIAGYAYATRWRARAAYRHSAESTVYLAPPFQGRGIGKQLYAELIARLRAQGLHQVIGGVALPNPGSVALHERLGFRKVAQFSEVGWKFGRWIDVAYWQLTLGTGPIRKGEAVPDRAALREF